MLLCVYHCSSAAAGLQDGKKPAIPKLDELLAPDSDSEEEPDLELQLPANKVKYMVGQGGDKIKYIQRKTKCRVQVHGSPTAFFLLLEHRCNMTMHLPCSNARRCKEEVRVPLLIIEV